MRYDDIIGMERPRSSKHPPMPQTERAAQFSPFAALTGYEEAIQETRRLTERKLTLTEDEKALIDERLREAEGSEEKELTITYFLKDPGKEGGEYITVPARLKKLDRIAGLVILSDGLRIPVDDIYSVSGQAR